MEATAAAILVQAMLQSSPPLQGSLREDLQKGGPQAGAEFLKPYFIAAARMLMKAEEKGQESIVLSPKSFVHNFVQNRR